MTNENETVADIVREMKTYRNAEAFVECDDGSLDFVSVTDDLPIRIEAAHKREMERLAVPTPEQWTEIACQGSELADLKRENERLREALRKLLFVVSNDKIPTERPITEYYAIVDAEAALAASSGEKDRFKDAVHAAKRIAQKDLPCQHAKPCPCIPDGICEGCEKEKCIKGGK